MKHVVLFVLLVAVSIAKPTNEDKETEKSLQNDPFSVSNVKSPTQSILFKRGPIIIKSKRVKPKTKKRYIGVNAKPKALVEQDSKKSAITFALDSDDNSLSSVISMILKLLEQEEQAEINSKKTNSAIYSKISTEEIPQKPISLTDVPKLLPNTKSEIIVPQSSGSAQNENLNGNTEVPVMQVTVSSQTSSETRDPLNSSIQLSITTPSDFILDTSVSFEPAFNNNSIFSELSEENKENLPNKPDILKFDKSNNEEESSGDFSNETDEDSTHYCPDGIKDEDESNTGDSVGDLEKLISSSENRLEAPVEISKNENVAVSLSEGISQLNSEIQTEASKPSLTETDSVTQFVTETVATTLESLDTDARLSETTTPNILTDLEEILTAEELAALTRQEPSTTEAQNEDMTSHVTEMFNYISTEREGMSLLTTTEPFNVEHEETTEVFNQIVTGHDHTALPTITEINKSDFNEVVDKTTTNILQPYTNNFNELTTVTDQPVLLTTIAKESDVTSAFNSNKVSVTPEPLLLESYVESSQSHPVESTMPVVELQMAKNETLVTGELDNKLKETIKTTTEIVAVEAASVSQKELISSQLTKIVSSPLSLSFLNITSSQPDKEIKQDNNVEDPKIVAKTSKPHSRLITFTVYDRKEKYTSLKHFIDYLKTLKK